MSVRFMAVAIFASALLVSLAGCGSGEKQVPVFPVAGKVTFAGQPPVGALIVLHSTADNGAGDVAPTGTIKEDGSFKISSYGDGDGAPAGEYVATIEWFKVVDTGGGGGRGPNVLPLQYANRATSPVKITVANGPNEIAPINITR